MKKLLLPLIMALVGTGGGIAAGLFLLPPAPEPDHEIACAPLTDEDGNPVEVAAAPPTADAEATEAEAAPREYARLNNQFVVPVVTSGKVSALIVMSLSVEVPAGQKEPIFAAEPKLRDVFLQVLFDHANAGGFEGNFTSSSNMRILRRSLRQAAVGSMGDQITDVLIIDLVRQDV